MLDSKPDFAQHQDPAAFAPLYALQRQGLTEVVVHGSIAIASGDHVSFLRGGDFLCYGRSLIKPFQMKVFAHDFTSASGYSPEAQAISVASHNAETFHLEAAREFLSGPRRVISESMILTPACLPLNPVVACHPHQKLNWNHPCSGKHAAVLRGCELRGWPLENYLSQDHPYHQELMRALRDVLGANWKPVAMAVDGCGLPAPSMSVGELALLFSALGRDRKKDWIWDAMVRRPAWVGGTGRIDTAVMQESGGRVLAKEGADGLFALSFSDDMYPEGLAIVIKVAHGWNPLASRILAHHLLAPHGVNIPAPTAPDRQTIFIYS